VIEVARRRGAPAVVAETDPDNLASQRVLEKNGFVRTPADGEALRWRLPLA
jgi:RimJ/RimL family protein N-acetyltransferase